MTTRRFSDAVLDDVAAAIVALADLKVLEGRGAGKEAFDQDVLRTFDRDHIEDEGERAPDQTVTISRRGPVPAAISSCPA